MDIIESIEYVVEVLGCADEVTHRMYVVVSKERDDTQEFWEGDNGEFDQHD